MPSSKKKTIQLKEVLKNNSLSVVMLGFFVLFTIGLNLTGFSEYNSEQKDHKQPQSTFVEYLTSSHFQESLFENWESEFLQMWAFVILTIFLQQKGSPESKKLQGKEEVDTHSKFSLFKKHSSLRMREKGILNELYANSLGIALFVIFLISFILHAVSGAASYNEEAVAHAGKQVSTLQYIASARFWFESFQNWQSEFLAVGALIVLSIFPRQRGSPESKPVGDPHGKTGK